MKLEPMICRTQDEHTDHYATDAVYNFKKNLDIRFSVNKDQRWINVLYYIFISNKYRFCPYVNTGHSDINVEICAKALGPKSVSRYDNSLDMENGMH